MDIDIQPSVSAAVEPNRHVHSSQPDHKIGCGRPREDQPFREGESLVIEIPHPCVVKRVVIVVSNLAVYVHIEGIDIVVVVVIDLHRGRSVDTYSHSDEVGGAVSERCFGCVVSDGINHSSLNGDRRLILAKRVEKSVVA
jgi:hypothetical protein